MFTLFVVTGCLEGTISGNCLCAEIPMFRCFWSAIKLIHIIFYSFRFTFQDASSLVMDSIYSETATKTTTTIKRTHYTCLPDDSQQKTESLCAKVGTLEPRSQHLECHFPTIQPSFSLSLFTADCCSISHFSQWRRRHHTMIRLAPLNVSLYVNRSEHHRRTHK